MTAIGREVGIDFAFDRMQRTPNTRLAHRLIWEAGRQGRQNAIVDRLFRAYFEEALDIGSADVLKRTCRRGRPRGRQAWSVHLPMSASLDAVVELEQQGYRMGIQGVPFFIVLGKYGISGAQPPELWREALPKIAAEAELAAEPARAAG